MWFAIIVIATAASNVGCIQDRPTNDFNLTAVAFPDDMYFTLLINSAVPDKLCFRIKDRDRSKVSANVWYTTISINTKAVLTPGIRKDDLPEGYKPVCLLPGGEMLYSNRFRDSSGEFSHNIILSDAKGNEEVLLPHVTSATGMKGISSLSYSREHGLVLFVPDFQGGFTVWDESKAPEDRQFIGDVVAYGKGFSSGPLTHVFVLADGQVLTFDPELKLAVPDPARQWLGYLAEACDISLHNDREYFFAFAADVAAVRLDDVVLLIDNQGTTYEVKCHSVIEKDYRGFPRTRRQIKEASLDFLYYKEEGKRVGSGQASTFSSTMPFDETRVAVFDKDYQRLIIVEKVDQE